MKDKEEKVSRLLASLKTVNAPEGFEGGVRTRIAQRRQEGPAARPTIFLVAKFALPLVVLFVLGGFLIFSDDSAMNVNMVPPVVEQRQDLAMVEESDPEPGAVVEANSGGVPARPIPLNRRQQTVAPAPQGGSQDLGLSPDDSAVFPAGVDPRNARITNTRPPNVGGITPLSILSFIGVSGSCSPVSCQVHSVGPSTLAAKAGIQPGDVVEEIDGRPIDSFRGVTGAVTVRSLRILRNGKGLTIPIGRP